MDLPSQGGMPYGHLEDLLRQNLEVAQANHKILKRMERNALIGFVVKLLIWLILLGVPIFFLGSYLTPLLSVLEGDKSKPVVPQGLFGLPSADQLKQILDAYRPQK